MSNSDSIKIIEKQDELDSRRIEKQRMNKEFEEAIKDESFTAFNNIVNVITASVSLFLCGYFLWTNNKYILVVVVILILLSFVFKYLAKRNFAKGNKRKFMTYNKLSKVTGIATSAFEAIDNKKGHSKGAFDKLDSVSSNLSKASDSIAAQQQMLLSYSVAKYNDIRIRALNTGKYMYFKMGTARIISYLDLFDKKLNTLNINMYSKYRMILLSKGVHNTIKSTEPIIEDNDKFYMALGAIYYFNNPITDLPNNVPLVGYKDNMFVPYCVYAGDIEYWNKYQKRIIDRNTNEQLSNAQDNSMLIIESLFRRGSEAKLSNLEIIESFKKNKSLTNHPNYNEMLLICDMLEQNDNSCYNLDDETRNLFRGLLLLCTERHYSDYIAIDEYSYSCNVIIRLVCDIYTYRLEDFSLNKITLDMCNESDILTEYLNSVIGNDDKARTAEITRLSKLCPDNNVKDKKERARITLQCMF